MKLYSEEDRNHAKGGWFLGKRGEIGQVRKYAGCKPYLDCRLQLIWRSVDAWTELRKYVGDVKEDYRGENGPTHHHSSTAELDDR